MSTKNEENEKKEYNINDEEDYVIIIRKDGTSNGFYPNQIMREQGQIDARFIAATYVLQDQQCFDSVLEKFKEDRLPQLQAQAEESAAGAEEGGTTEAAE